MNSVCLIGRITKDIELRYTESGLACVSMFIAINNGKDKDGNEKQADFPKIYVYDKQAENLEKYCHKGSQVAITGRLKTRSWEREDGSRAYETYVMANRVQFLDSKQSETVPLPEPDYNVSHQNETEEENDPFKDFGEQIQINENELPFN